MPSSRKRRRDREQDYADAPSYDLLVSLLQQLDPSDGTAPYDWVEDGAECWSVHRGMTLAAGGMSISEIALIKDDGGRDTEANEVGCWSWVAADGAG